MNDIVVDVWKDLLVLKVPNFDLTLIFFIQFHIWTTFCPCPISQILRFRPSEAYKVQKRTQGNQTCKCTLRDFYNNEWYCCWCLKGPLLIYFYFLLRVSSGYHIFHWTFQYNKISSCNIGLIIGNEICKIQIAPHFKHLGMFSFNFN